MLVLIMTSITVEREREAAPQLQDAFGQPGTESALVITPASWTQLQPAAAGCKPFSPRAV